MRSAQPGSKTTNRFEVDQDESIEWLELVIAVVSMVALVVIYLLLPQNTSSEPLLDLFKACIPNAVTALVVIPIFFFVFRRAGLTADQKLYRAIQAALHSGRRTGKSFDDDVAGIATEVKGFVAALSANEKINLRILGYTGATFTTALLRDLIDRNPHRLSIDLHVMHFPAEKPSLYPAHWPQEVLDTQRRLGDLCRGRAALKIFEYTAFPFVLGLEMNERHLFLAFPRWEPGQHRLSDSSLKYLYYERNADSAPMFDVFRNWIEQPGQAELPIRTGDAPPAHTTPT